MCALRSPSSVKRLIVRLPPGTIGDSLPDIARMMEIIIINASFVVSTLDNRQSVHCVLSTISWGRVQVLLGSWRGGCRGGQSGLKVATHASDTEALLVTGRLLGLKLGRLTIAILAGDAACHHCSCQSGVYQFLVIVVVKALCLTQGPLPASPNGRLPPPPPPAFPIIGNVNPPFRRLNDRFVAPSSWCRLLI
jgi:hypothetical protein